MNPYFYFFIRLLSASFCQDGNKNRSNCAIIGSNLSKKCKLTLYKIQNGEPNYVARSSRSYLYKNLGTDISIL